MKLKNKKPEPQTKTIHNLPLGIIEYFFDKVICLTLENVLKLLEATGLECKMKITWYENNVDASFIIEVNNTITNQWTVDITEMGDFSKRQLFKTLESIESYLTGYMHAMAKEEKNEP